MRVPCLGGQRPVDFNITPLIDVVFLLIIFFLVSSHLARQETQIDLRLPEAQSGREELQHQMSRVTINLMPDGSLVLGGDRVALPEVQGRLQVEREQTSADLEVRIRVDRQLAYRYLEPVLLACARANTWNVSFAVLPSPEAEVSP